MNESSFGRLSRNLRQFIQFGMVGASGTVVNLVVVVLSKKVAWWLAGITEHDAFVNILGSAFHVRWYHVFVTLAFLVANTWNYQLNRMWTFKAAVMRSWWRGYIPFLLTGLGALLVNLAMMTLMMNSNSPISLPEHIFDDSTGLRTKFYWASVISILAGMPVNFIINKLWAFRRPKVRVVAEEPPARQI